MDNLLIKEQKELQLQINQLLTNAKKEPLVRRTEEYAQKKLVILTDLWDKFNQNDDELRKLVDAASPYFTDGIYDAAKEKFDLAVAVLNDYLDQVRKDEINKTVPSQDQKERSALLNVDERRKRLLYRLNNLEETIRDSEAVSNRKHSRRFIQNQINDISKLLEDVKIQNEEVAIKAADNEVADLEQISGIVRDATKRANYIINQLYEQVEAMENEDQIAKRAPKLSPLTIPKFDGQYKKWMSFKNLFMSIIHDNKKLSNVEKLQYLQTNVVGEVSKMISHLQLTNANYEVALQLIMDRYDNQRKMVDVYLDILLDLPATLVRSAASVKTFHDTVKEGIEGLSTAGVDFNETPLLTRLCLKKLDTDSLKAFEEGLKNPKQVPSFQILMEFLEKRHLLLDTLEENKNSKKISANYIQENNLRCAYCKESHLLFSCKKFGELSVYRRNQFVQKEKLCKNCMCHKANKACVSKTACLKCGKNHHTMLHFQKNAKTESSNKLNEVPSKQGVSQIISTHLRNKGEVLLSTALVYIKNSYGRYEPFRALLDQGSQASLISESAAQILGLPRYTSDVQISGVGTGAPKKARHRIFIDVRSHFGNKTEVQVPVYILPKLTGDLPNKIIKDDATRWKNIILADPQYTEPGTIDVLLGADVYGSILLKGIKKGYPTAIRTKLGWILSGHIKNNESVNVVQTNVSLAEINDSITRFWNTENVSSTTESHNDDIIYQKLNINRDDNGRYIVDLPFKNGEPKLGDSRRQAVARLLQVERSLESQPFKKQLYHDFIKEYIQCGHMIQLQKISPNEGYYLPHHAVVNMDKATTKLRVVFDASAKSSNGVSLNDELMIGPPIQDNLNTILMRWRTHRLVFTADVEKMYRQIKMQEKHQKYQKILWRFSKNEPIQDFALTTVTYGTAAASYTATRVLKQIADDTTEEMYRNITKPIKQDFYMDDLMSGADTEKEAIAVIHNLNYVLTSAGFTLRKWASNNPTLLEKIPLDFHLTSLVNLDNEGSIKMLGVWWNPNTDSFSYMISIEETVLRTKRSFLSKISKIFDPLGWLAPITINAKLMMQDVWASGEGWDEVLSESLQQRWKKWEKELPSIRDLSIPRYLQINKESNFEIHGFSDASEKAYAAAVFIRVKDSFNNYSTFLLGAKTRVAPLSKELTIPRLELCGALLLTNYINEIRSTFQTDNVPTYYWTDSMITLAWIKGTPSRWKSFVANRVAEIQKSTNPEHWFYINTKENPADLASRGIRPDQIINNQLWWHGPSWLLDDWQSLRHQPEFITKEEEKVNKTHTNVVQLQSNDISDIISRFSSLEKLVRVVAYLKRFKNKYKGKLSTTELNDAILTIVKQVQQNEYTMDINYIKAGKISKISSKLLQLSPYIDDMDILRVGGRLENLKIQSIAKHPIILPASNLFSKLLVTHAHHQTMHGGNQLTLAYVRQSYWITNAKCLVRRVIHNCMKCFRFKAESAKQLMGNLPAERINPAPAFLNTGVDYAGPIDIRVSKGRGNKSFKGYMAVFVCMATKAVHLEVVSDLTADAFIAAYKRFSSRRGNCLNIYSDNGTNFVGACKKMNKDILECVQKATEYLSKDIKTNQTTWHFIPPKAPHFGGIWEAAVKSMKNHLKKVIGEQKLTFEELTTVLSQIEACLNSRPLVQLSNDPADIEVLTPGHFLIGRPIIADPQPGIIKMNYGSRWKLLTKMVQDFWKVWSNEYLSRLQHRPKWMKKEKNLEVGDLVLIKEENLPPTRWALGRITETHPGKDGLVRAVTLRGSGHTIFKRPITKICRLPLQDENNQTNDIAISALKSTVTKVNVLQTKKIHTAECTSTIESKIPFKNPPRNWMRGTNIDDLKDKSHKFNEQCNKREIKKRKGTVIRPYVPAKFLFLTTIIACCFSVIGAALIFNTEANQEFSVQKFPHQPGIFFEDIGNLRFQRNEWNLVIYYKFETYNEILNQLETLLLHLSETCHYADSMCTSITVQCQYLMHNIKKLDIVIKNSNKDMRLTHQRLHKRGLINGIGYVANELFGILDARSAEKYEEQISELQKNQNYLKELAKNHTSITDVTLEVFKESMEYVQQELKFINKSIQKEKENNSYVAIVLKLILTMMRIQEVQDKLLDAILDTHHGKLNPILLSPTDLVQELNFIRNHISAEVMTPDIINDNLADLYNLMSIKSRVTKDNIIFSVRFPLPDVELYEIYKLVPLPITYKHEFMVINPSSEYLVINAQRDHYYPMNKTELDSCITIAEYIFICNPHSPLYNIQSNISKCEVDLINHKEDYLQSCTMHLCPKFANWIQLTKPNTWIYAMDDNYPIDIACNSKVVNSTILKGQGIVHVKQGCLLKQNGLTIFARNSLKSSIQSNFFPLIDSEKILKDKEADDIKGFKVSASVVQNKLSKLQERVNQQRVFDENLNNFTHHDIHQYTAIGVILIIITVMSVYGFITYRWKLSGMLAASITSAINQRLSIVESAV